MRNIYYISIICLLFFSTSLAQTGCDLNLIRQTFTAAGCTELENCLSTCSIYFYNPISQTGNAAQAWAQNYGANLISVQSATENNCIVNDLNTHGFSGIIWIGFNDVASENNFVWYDQSPIVYTNWSGGEPNNSGDEDCVQIYPNGMWNDLSCTSSGSKSVIEVNLCPVTTITPSATSICAGQSATLSASTILGSSPYTYSWISNLGGFVSTSSGPTVTPLTTTTYSVTATDRYGCTSSTSIEITVNTSLNATITGTTSVCKDAPSPDITFTGASGTTPYTFTYMINGGANQTVTTSSGNSVTIPAPTGATGTFNYILLNVADANGCSQSQSGTAVITVTSLPTASISGTTTVCQGVTAPDITFTGFGGSTPYTFTYTINGGANQTVTTSNDSSIAVSVSTATSGTFIYSLVSVQSGSSVYCSQTQSGTVTVTVNPLPTATIMGSTTVCEDAASPDITFTGAGGTAPYTFTYTINNGINLTIVTTGGNSVTLPVPTTTAGSFVYSLVSVQDASSTTCSQPQTGSATITINPLPTATVTGTTIVCKNAPAPDIIFTGSSATAPYTFTYMVNSVVQPTVTTTGGNSITVSVPTSVEGTFTYGLVSVKDASTASCIQLQSGSATITVNPLPTATITSDITVCKNASAPDIIFTGANGTVPYTFTYTINGGTSQTVVSTNGNSAGVAAPTSVVGSFTYDLISVQDASSATCSQAQTGSAIVTVNPLPTATITGTAVVCQDSGQPTITFAGANGTPPYTFTFTINNGNNQTVSSSNSANDATVVVSTSAAGIFVYDLVSIQDGSSTTCSQLQTGTATVTVNPLPTALITGTTGLCENAAPPIITFTGANGTQPYTFTYTLNSGPNQTLSTTIGNSASVSVPTGDNGTYAYTLVSVQESSSTSCSQAQDGIATVTVNPNPDVNFSTSDSIGCGPLCVSFIDLSDIDSGVNTNWLWDFGDGAIGSNAQNHCYVNDLANGGSTYSPLPYTITLTVTSDSGCTGVLTKNNFITVYPDPIAAFSVLPQTTSIVNPVISVTDLSLGVAAWMWDFGDMDTVLSQTPLPHIYADTGIYQIVLITSNQYTCRDTASQTIKIEPDFILFVPNAFTPNGDGINDTFGCKGLFATTFDMKIFDRWGNLIFASDDINKPWDGTANHGTEAAQQDIYIYSIKITDINRKKYDYKGMVTLVR